MLHTRVFFYTCCPVRVTCDILQPLNTSVRVTWSQCREGGVPCRNICSGLFRTAGLIWGGAGWESGYTVLWGRGGGHCRLLQEPHSHSRVGHVWTPPPPVLRTTSEDICAEIWEFRRTSESLISRGRSRRFDSVTIL